MVVEFPNLHHDVHLPDIGAVAAFSLQGECRLEGGYSAPATSFTGLYETSRAHEHRHHHAVLLATFTPVGAAALLRAPLEEFAGVTTDLASILGQPTELHQIQELFAEAANHSQRIGLLENFLLARLGVSEPDPLVTAAVAWLEQGRGSRRIEDLTRYIGLSQSALERRFRRIVGVSPKRFASLVRLQQAVRLRTNGTDFATAAQTAGYFDQSHFIKDFRRATGTTPDLFFRTLPAN